jgi:HEAT repeat protein
MKSADSIVRQSAAHALGQLQAKEAVHELIALLKDEDAEVRKSAAYAFAGHLDHLPRNVQQVVQQSPDVLRSLE